MASIAFRIGMTLHFFHVPIDPGFGHSSELRKVVVTEVQEGLALPRFENRGLRHQPYQQFRSDFCELYHKVPSPHKRPDEKAWIVRIMPVSEIYRNFSEKRVVVRPKQSDPFDYTVAEQLVVVPINRSWSLKNKPIVLVERAANLSAYLFASPRQRK